MADELAIPGFVSCVELNVVLLLLVVVDYNLLLLFLKLVFYARFIGFKQQSYLFRFSAVRVFFCSFSCVAK